MARLYFSKGLDLFVVHMTTRWQSCVQKKKLSRIKRIKMLNTIGTLEIRAPE